jgi:ABC-2 type transport system permease protein
MKQIMRLFSVQVWALLGDMFFIGSGKKKKPKVLYAGILLFVTAMAALAFFYFYMMGKVLLQYDSIEILPSLTMAASSLLVLMTTIFKVKGTIFGFRDYDLMMSLPVSTSKIVASRVLLLYSLNIVFVVMLMVPMMVAYGLLAEPGILFYISGSIMMFFVPLVPLLLASVLGTLLAFVSARFRHSNLVSILVYILAMILILALSFTTSGSDVQIINMSRYLTEQVNDAYPPAYFYGKAVIDKDSRALIAFLLISLGSFFLYSYLAGKFFRKLNSLAMAGSYRKNYKLNELTAASPLKALFRKEIKRYFSSPVYVLNTGIGIVLLTIGAIALFFIDLNKLGGDPQLSWMLAQGGPLFISFCIATSCTTMASVSLEGSSLWIVKSLPVPTGTIFASKILVNLLITAPAMLDAVLITIALRLGVMTGLLLILVALMSALFISMLGLVVNLKFPNLTWTSETVVVKQSAASMLTVFGSLLTLGLQVLLLMLIKDFIFTYLLYLGILALGAALIYRILMTYGVKRFQEL